MFLRNDICWLWSFRINRQVWIKISSPGKNVTRLWGFSIFMTFFGWWNCALSDLEEYSSHGGGWSVYDIMSKGIVEQMLNKGQSCEFVYFVFFVFLCLCWGIYDLMPRGSVERMLKRAWEEGVSVGWAQASNSSRRLIHPSWKTQMWPGFFKSDELRRLSLCQLSTRWASVSSSYSAPLETDMNLSTQMNSGYSELRWGKQRRQFTPLENLEVLFLDLSNHCRNHGKCWFW